MVNIILTHVTICLFFFGTTIGILKMKKPKTIKKSLLCAAILCSFNGMAADNTPAENGAEEKAVERITVTSRKKEETIIEIPMSVSSVSSTEIENRNYLDAQDLYRTLAGAAMPRGQLILRGLSGGNSAAPGTTTTFTDDVPFAFTNLADVERVEVLRGPQGTLYGSNAIGGTVRVITNKPRMNEFELFGSMQIKSEKNVEGYDDSLSIGVNLPLIEDTLALRATGNLYNDQRPYVNMYNGNQSEAQGNFIRTQLLWTPTEQTDVILGYVKTEYRSKGSTLGDTSKPGGYWRHDYTPDENAPYGYEVDHAWVECDENLIRPKCILGDQNIADAPEKYMVYNLIDGSYRSETDLVTLTVEQDNIFDIASMTYAGSYREFKDGGLDDWSRLDASDLFRTWIINDDFYDRTTHELRFQNIDVNSDLSWTVGMFYDKVNQPKNPNVQWQYHEAGDRVSASTLYWWGVDATQTGLDNFGTPSRNWNSARVSAWSEEFALFADAAYNFDLGDMGDLELNVGLRRFELEDYSHTTSAGIWSEDNVITGGEEDGYRKKISVSYMPSDNYSVYTLYSEGYRPGGNNAPLAQSCAADPKAKDRKDRYTSDSIDNYEVGFKGSAFGGRFNFATAVYHIDWTDVKTSIYMDTCGFSYTANGGGARSRGIEFESTADLGYDTTLVFNASYTNSELTEDNDAISGKAGDEMTMVPKYNGYLALDKGFELNGKPAFVRLDVATYGSYFTHFNTKDGDEVPGYTTLNLSGRYEVSDDVKLSVHINNLLDSEDISYQRQRSRTNTTTAQTYIDFLPERNIAVRIDYTFF